MLNVSVCPFFRDIGYTFLEQLFSDSVQLSHIFQHFLQLSVQPEVMSTNFFLTTLLLDHPVYFQQHFIP